MDSDSKEQFVTLDDGRVTSYLQFGDPEGFPVFYLHGTPGSALEGAIFAQASWDAGVNVIALDRPGIAGSTPQPNRQVKDYAPVVSQVADSLGHEEFSIMGWSGGAPYALVVGALLRKRVRAIGLLSPQAPLDEAPQPLMDKAMTAFHHAITAVANAPLLGPALLTSAFWIDDITRRKPRPQGTFRSVLAASTIRSAANGAGPGIEDSRALSSEWGIPLAQIRAELSEQTPPVPVWVIQGGKDWITSTKDVLALVNEIPNAHLVFDKYASHLQVLLDSSETIIAAMREPV